LSPDCNVFGWGQNDSGQINCPNEKFITVSGGRYHSLGLRRDGKVIGWGSNVSGQIDCPDEKFISIAAGGNHSLGLKSNGEVICWGCNSWGQLKCPSKKANWLSFLFTGTKMKFIAISAGAHHSLGLRADGRVFGWGCNANGQIDCPDEKFIAVTAGQYYSLGLRADGKVIGWGGNYEGQTNLPDEKFALPYDFLARLNKGLNVLAHMPKYIKMEIMEEYTGWTFGNLFYL
jgi:alpha-tubulin suppressor-like RCC1 family protein